MLVTSERLIALKKYIQDLQEDDVSYEAAKGNWDGVADLQKELLDNTKDRWCALLQAGSLGLEGENLEQLDQLLQCGDDILVVRSGSEYEEELHFDTKAASANLVHAIVQDDTTSGWTYYQILARVVGGEGIAVEAIRRQVADAALQEMISYRKKGTAVDAPALLLLHEIVNRNGSASQKGQAEKLLVPRFPIEALTRSTRLRSVRGFFRGIGAATSQLFERILTPLDWPRRHWRWILGGLAGLVAIGVLLFVFLVWQPWNHGESPPTVPPPTSVAIPCPTCEPSSRPVSAPPVVDSIEPNNAIAGELPPNLMLTGANWQEESQVWIAKMPHRDQKIQGSIENWQSSELKVALPSTLAPGVYVIWVENIDGQKSEPLGFVIKSKDTGSQVEIEQAPATVAYWSQPFEIWTNEFHERPLVLMGEHLGQVDRIEIRGEEGSLGDLEIENREENKLETWLREDIPAGHYQLTLFDKEGNEVAASLELLIRGGAPVVSQIDPSIMQVGDLPAWVTLSGESFLRVNGQGPTAYYRRNSVLSGLETLFVDEETLQIKFPDLLPMGKFYLEVENPDQQWFHGSDDSFVTIEGPACDWLAEFDEETVPDYFVFAPGMAFVKTWWLMNSSKGGKHCAWPMGTTYRSVDGEAMGGQTVSAESVAPGKVGPVTIYLYAPEEPGIHTGRWQLHTPDGTPIKNIRTVTIVVATLEPGEIAGAQAQGQVIVIHGPDPSTGLSAQLVGTDGTVIANSTQGEGPSLELVIPGTLEPDGGEAKYFIVFRKQGENEEMGRLRLVVN